MPRSSSRAPAGRYDPREIALRIERMRVEARVLAKEAAGACGLTEPQWSKKMTHKGSSFSIPELGRIADYFSRVTGKRLTGWPFVDATVSELLDQLRPKH